MAKKLRWERVSETWGGRKSPVCSTWRAPVHGGWLVTVWAGPNAVDTNKHANGGGLTFVPDPEHRWKVEPHPDRGK